MIVVFLQDLNKSKLILWKKDATNKVYIGQLKNAPILHHFKLIAKAYELGWYGKHPISFDNYKAVASFIDQSMGLSKQSKND